MSIMSFLLLISDSREKLQCYVVSMFDATAVDSYDTSNDSPVYSVMFDDTAVFDRINSAMMSNTL